MARTRIAAAVAATALIALATPVGAADPQTPTPFLRGLDFPTNVAFAPDGRLFFVEKETGRVRVVVDGKLDAQPVATFDVAGSAERGLLGLAVDPAFATHPWIYVYYSDAASGRNLLARFREDRPGRAAHVLLTGLESASGYHNGGDLVFGTDGLLYASLGEAHDPTRAQDPSDLGGTIVRLSPDGGIPSGRPFGADNPVWSFGHRNSFGLCVDPVNGDLWETENGPDRDDELNLIERGGNYGWPEVTGRAGDDAFVDPIAVFPDTVALTGCAVIDGTVYAGAYKDATLYRLPAADRASGRMQAVASFDAGITDVAAGPGGRLYIATSDAIWTLDPLGLPAPPDDGHAGSWIAVAAAAVLMAGLGLRLAAGRRLRRGAGDDG